MLVTRPGSKQGRRSQASLEARRTERAGQMEESRLKAESNWGKFTSIVCKPLIPTIS
jgi:hypothetical protein